MQYVPSTNYAPAAVDSQPTVPGTGNKSPYNPPGGSPHTPPSQEGVEGSFLQEEDKALQDLPQEAKDRLFHLQEVRDCQDLLQEAKDLQDLQDLHQEEPIGPTSKVPLVLQEIQPGPPGAGGAGPRNNQPHLDLEELIYTGAQKN
ncbi:hypothetical protein FRC06_005517 [Ceratobasidium sp. 370]|nr:hypothetical protein FRC06_005517 [Ceratobasidium sp. 370]